MIKWLIQHHRKEKTRSHYWQKSIWLKILFGIIILYFTLNLLALGFFVDKVIIQVFPGADPVEKLTGILFYYFIFDLLARFFLQELPIISIAPYLHLPIKKNRIFNYLLAKSTFSFFNLLPLLVLIPFMVKVIVPAHSFLYGTVWMGSVILLALSSNYFTFYLKKYFSLKPFAAIAILILFGIFLYLDYLGYLHISEYFGFFILSISANPLLIIVPVSLLWLSYNLASNLLKKNAYLENILDKPGKDFKAINRLSFLNKYGNIGDFIQLELKMIWRNSRPKLYIFTVLFFIPYCLLIYNNEKYMDSFAVLIGVGVFLTGVFMMQYGLLMFSWESSYFDFLLVRNMAKTKFVVSKYWFLFYASLFVFILTVPFGLIDVKIIAINFSTLLFNIGINIFILMFVTSYNTKPIDLSRSAMFNYEGFSVVNALLIFPLIGLPILIYLPFGLSGHIYTGLTMIGLVGFCGIIFRETFLGLIIKQLNERQYIVSEEFRKGW